MHLDYIFDYRITLKGTVIFRGNRRVILVARFSGNSYQINFSLAGTFSTGNLNDTNNVKQSPSPPCPPLNSRESTPCGLCCATSFPNNS